jgi:tetratricopeptide (TPR) repeat protein
MFYRSRIRRDLLIYFEKELSMTLEPAQLDQKGKESFQNGDYEEAADFFRRAVEGFAFAQDNAAAAESKNNMSVALLQAGKPQEALDAVLGTDAFFESLKDIKRQAMALGNQAAALEALDRLDEAVAAYERSAELFTQVGEGDMRAMVLKSAAAIKLKKGKVAEAAFKMMGSLDAKEHPGIFDRIMKFFLRLIKK